jgi:hypothetical protein
MRSAHEPCLHPTTGEFLFLADQPGHRPERRRRPSRLGLTLVEDQANAAAQALAPVSAWSGVLA